MIMITSNWNTRYELMLKIGLETGLRVTDILNLKASDIANGTTQITEKKTGKNRAINFSNELMGDMRNHINNHSLKDDDYIIFSASTRHNKPLSRVRAWQVMKRVSFRCNESEIATHSMRKTYARSLYRECKDVLKVQQELNHKYLSTTLGYLLDEDALKNLPV